MKLYAEAVENNARFYVVDLNNLYERIQGMTKDQAMEVLHNECVSPVCKILKISPAEHVERCASDSVIKVNSMMLANYREARRIVITSTIGEMDRRTCLRIASRYMDEATFDLLRKDGETLQ